MTTRTQPSQKQRLITRGAPSGSTARTTHIPQTHKTVHHNDKTTNDGIAYITINHPFHPDNGKRFEYLSEANDKVRCLDEGGALRLLPIRYTDLHIDAVGEFFADGRFVVPVDDLLAVKKLVDGLPACRDV